MCCTDALRRCVRMRDLSIIVPVLNEPTAPAIVREMYKIFGKDTEIIVVNKSDKRITNAFIKAGAKVVDQNPLGYENALVQGFRLAKGDILATIDADGTYDPKDLGNVVSEIRTGKYGFVSSARMEGRNQAMSHTIRFGNGFLTRMFNVLYRQKMLDVLSGVFAITRDAFEDIRHIDPYRAGTLFFEIEVSRMGYKTHNIIGTYKARPGTKSRITKSKPFYGITIAYHAIRYARDYNPLIIFGGIGIIAIVVGIVIGAFVVLSYLQFGTLLEVGRALIAFMLVIGGFLSIIAGLILDLLLGIEKRIYRQRKM